MANKMKRNIFPIIGFIIISYSLSAQPLRSVPRDMMIEAAEESYKKGDYYNAVEWYEKAYKEEKDKDIAAEVAYLHYLLRDYKRAENWYRRILRRDRDNRYASERMIYGLVFKALGKYPEALEQFNFVINDENSDAEDRQYAEHQIAGIELANELPQNIEAVITLVDKKNVNSGFSDFSPREYVDGSLYFASFLRDDEIVIEEKDDENAYAKIYYTTKGDKGYQQPTELGQHINRENFHNGNVSFSRDGNRMYFTRSELIGNELASSKIYVSYRSSSGWSAAQELSLSTGDYMAKHPTIGQLFGNEVLFFVSDMEGGMGGFDLYYSTLQGEDGYSVPVNLGEVVNTDSDEITPFYKDGTIYFSSKGHAGLGGYDIFSSDWDGTVWSDPANLGYNYNTSYDDMYYSKSADDLRGFLVSNRPDKEKRNLKSKTCCDDIYEIGIRQLVIDLLALVEDENGPLNGANVELFDLTTGSDGQFKTNTVGNDFNFLLESDRAYKAIVSRDEYFPDTVEFNTVGIFDDYTVRKTVVLEKLETEPEIEIITINQPIRLNNIYYDFDDDQILEAAEKDLYVLLDLMNQYPDMVIELSSHTDSRGITRYNEDLSQRRAESARTWLLEEGVNEDRIVAKGYGESKLLNRCRNGVRCSEEEHQFNRRTEFKIIAGPQSIEIKKEVIKGPSQKKNN